MQNSVVKYMLDHDLLSLNGSPYYPDISIESNPELNDLELKQRKEIASMMAALRGVGTTHTPYSSFEPAIAEEIISTIQKMFLPIGNTELRSGQLFIWAYLRNCIPRFFPNWGGKMPIMFGVTPTVSKIGVAPDPEKCYIGEPNPSH